MAAAEMTVLSAGGLISHRSPRTTHGARDRNRQEEKTPVRRSVQNTHICIFNVFLGIKNSDTEFSLETWSSVGGPWGL